MELTGRRVLPFDRATVWRGLNDPEILRQSISGCESMEAAGDGRFDVAMLAALGPVRAKFRGKLALEDVVALERYTLRFEGEGGPAGFAKGEARVRLGEAEGGTALEYAVKAQVGGRIAQVGNRLVNAAALKLADDFFAQFEKVLAPPPGTARAPAASPGRKPPLWVLAAILLAAILAAALYAALR